MEVLGVGQVDNRIHPSGESSGISQVLKGIVSGYEEPFGYLVRELRAEVAIVLGHVMDLKREGVVLSVKDCAMLLRFGMSRRVGDEVNVDFSVYMGIGARCMDVVRSVRDR